MLSVQWWLDALGGLYQQYGYYLVFLGALGENTALLGLLLPGSTLALLGGVYARQGELNLAVVVVLAWWGTVLGYHLDYVIGRMVLTRIAGRLSATPLGRKMRLAGRLRQASMLLARHGGKAILISHIIGHIRSVVALSAGMSRMRYRRFLAFELVAGLIWASAYVLVGYWAGMQGDWLQPVIERAGWVIVAILVLLHVGWRLARPGMRRRIRRRMRQTQQVRRAQHTAAAAARPAQPAVRVRTTVVRASAGRAMHASAP